jgi:hypothetical protein
MSSSIEKKLAEYRIRHTSMNVTKTTIKNEDVVNTVSPTQSSNESPPANRFKLTGLISPAVDYLCNTRPVQAVTDQSIHHPYACLVIKISFWLLLWMWFIAAGFGSVFFVLSLFYGLYASLGTRPRTDGAPSAYSVFNRNCERIDGTFTAEQLERELVGGPFLVH